MTDTAATADAGPPSRPAAAAAAGAPTSSRPALRCRWPSWSLLAGRRVLASRLGGWAARHRGRRADRRDDLPARARPLPHRQVGRHEGHRVLPRLRAPLWSFRRGETEYGIKAIPAGAYVRIIGMNNLEEVPPEDEPAPTASSRYRQPLSVAVAGSTMHFLIAFVLSSWPGRRSACRRRYDPPTRMDEISQSATGPTARRREAGLQPGDQLVVHRRHPGRRAATTSVGDRPRSARQTVAESSIEPSTATAHARRAHRRPDDRATKRRPTGLPRRSGRRRPRRRSVGPVPPVVGARRRASSATVIGVAVRALGSFFAPTGLRTTPTRSSTGDTSTPAATSQADVEHDSRPALVDRSTRTGCCRSSAWPGSAADRPTAPERARCLLVASQHLRSASSTCSRCCRSTAATWRSPPTRRIRRARAGATTPTSPS